MATARQANLRTHQVALHWSLLHTVQRVVLTDHELAGELSRVEGKSPAVRAVKLHVHQCLKRIFAGKEMPSRPTASQAEMGLTRKHLVPLHTAIKQALSQEICNMSEVLGEMAAPHADIYEVQERLLGTESQHLAVGRSEVAEAHDQLLDGTDE